MVLMRRKEEKEKIRGGQKVNEQRQRKAQERGWSDANSYLSPPPHPYIIQYTFRSNSQCLLDIFPISSSNSAASTPAPRSVAFLSPSLWLSPFHIHQKWPLGWETLLWNVKLLWIIFFFSPPPFFFFWLRRVDYRHMHTDVNILNGF